MKPSKYKRQENLRCTEIQQKECCIIYMGRIFKPFFTKIISFWDTIPVDLVELIVSLYCSHDIENF